MEERDKSDHPLSLKVMRLPKPSIATPLVVTCENTDLPADLFNLSLKNDVTAVKGMETLAIGQFLCVPQSFGNLYLGEVFSCYVCVHNFSEDVVNNVELKVDLQTLSQKQISANGASAVALQPNDSLDHVIYHEVKELGTHMLSCEVTYNSTFVLRKFFKLEVLKPLDVKTKFYTEGDNVFLEVSIQNITSGPICLESVTLQPYNCYNVTDLNTVRGSSIFGELNMMDKMTTRQYLFAVSADFSISSDCPIDLGILDMVWHSSMGERGHLQTSMLQTMPPYTEDVRLLVTELPSLVYLGEPFKFICRVSNLSLEKEVELTLNLEENADLAWHFVKSGAPLKKLQPRQYIEVPFHMMPLDCGLQSINGIRLRDTLSDKLYQFDNIGQVFVLNCKNEEVIDLGDTNITEV